MLKTVESKLNLKPSRNDEAPPGFLGISKEYNAVKIAKSPGLKEILQIGEGKFPQIAMLQRGEELYDARGKPVSGFGLEHIWAEHGKELAKAYGLKTKQDLADFIEIGLECMQPSSKAYEYVYQPPQGPSLRIIMGNVPGIFGIVTSAHLSG